MLRSGENPAWPIWLSARFSVFWKWICWEHFWEFLRINLNKFRRFPVKEEIKKEEVDSRFWFHVWIVVIFISKWSDLSLFWHLAFWSLAFWHLAIWQETFQHKNTADPYTLIRFANFWAKIISMAQLLQNYSNLNDFDYSRCRKVRKIEKRPKKILKAKQRPEVEKSKFS